jgi:hypothetical protein
LLSDGEGDEFLVLRKRYLDFFFFFFLDDFTLGLFLPSTDSFA